MSFVMQHIVPSRRRAATRAFATEWGVRQDAEQATQPPDHDDNRSAAGETEASPTTAMEHAVADWLSSLRGLSQLGQPRSDVRSAEETDGDGTPAAALTAAPQSEELVTIHDLLGHGR